MDSCESLSEAEWPSLDAFAKEFSRPVSDLAALSLSFDREVFSPRSRRKESSTFEELPPRDQFFTLNSIERNSSSMNPFTYYEAPQFAMEKPAFLAPRDAGDESSDDADDERRKVMEISHQSLFSLRGFGGEPEKLEYRPMPPFFVGEVGEGKVETVVKKATNFPNERRVIEIFDVEPCDNDCDASFANALYEEANLTSTSDLDLLNVRIEDAPSSSSKKATGDVKEEKPSQKHHHHHHHQQQQQQQQQIIIPNQSPLVFQIPMQQKMTFEMQKINSMEINAPVSIQTMRRPGGYQASFKKPIKQRMTDEEIQNVLMPKKQAQQQQPQAPPQKPLTNCCVAAAMGGSFRPFYTEYVNKEVPKIHWMAFPGLNLSPFEAPPTNTEDYLVKQKKKQDAGPNAVENEAIAINFCEICKSKFTDAVTHRASELHQQRAALCNWKDLEDLLSDMNTKFVQELDDPNS